MTRKDLQEKYNIIGENTEDRSRRDDCRQPLADRLQYPLINRNLNRFRPSPSNLPDTEKENAAPIFCSGGFLRDRNS